MKTFGYMILCNIMLIAWICLKHSTAGHYEGIEFHNEVS